MQRLTGTKRQTDRQTNTRIQIDRPRDTHTRGK